MLEIHDKRTGPHGEMWFTKLDIEKWKWFFMILPIQVQQDDWNQGPSPSLQRDSDLDLTELMHYLCKVPAVLFFPYVTCIVEDRFGGGLGPDFVIPEEPLDRLEGRTWLSALSQRQAEIIMDDRPEWRHGWIRTDDIADLEPGYTLSYLEVKRRATAALAFLLDDIRYVYDETKRSRASLKTNIPTRHVFSKKVVVFSGTKAYLEWYVSKINTLIDALLTKGQAGTPTGRERCYLAGFTINRLAIDLWVICTVDVPYIRKWQFFGFLDGLAALINEFDGTGHVGDRDHLKYVRLLEMQFFTNELEPVLNQIPVEGIRTELIAHTRTIYTAIDNLKMDDKSGAESLWLYRNIRHGFTLRDARDRQRILKHHGSIPNDLPDLAIALWQYILLRFPFEQSTLPAI